jgi:hypothetical protein
MNSREPIHYSAGKRPGARSVRFAQETGAEPNQPRLGWLRAQRILQTARSRSAVDLASCQAWPITRQCRSSRLRIVASFGSRKLRRYRREALRCYVRPFELMTHRFGLAGTRAASRMRLTSSCQRRSPTTPLWCGPTGETIRGSHPCWRKNRSQSLSRPLFACVGE